MAINLEKILVHANERLTTAAAESEREAQIEAFKRFLSIESSRLKNRHRFGLSGSDIASGRSYMIDLVVCRVCQSAASEHISLKDEISNCAVVALGGYGRRELSPCSDIDLLFLHAGKRSKGLEGFWEHVLYLLWDMGLTVGHSYRSVRECIAMGKDLHSRNAMSEARLITGSAPLFRRFTREMDENVFRNKSQTESYLEMMRLELEARYARFERTVCRLEPNVKESAGGLRDLHTVLWVGHTIHGARGLDDLRAQDRISGTEYAAARRAYDFILRLRNEAHFTTGRRTDLITLDLQPVLAENLGYRPKRGLLASEIFMRDYYQHAHELHRFSESFLTRVMGPRPTKRRLRARAKQIKATFERREGALYLTMGHRSPDNDAPSFEIRERRLFMREGQGGSINDPMRMMEIFSLAQSEGVDLSDELKVAIRGSLRFINRGFRASRDAGAAFIDILRRRGRVAAALRMMHDTGFLGRFLPEFGRITFLVQHDLYHKYTIDEHTLKAVEALDRTIAGEGAEASRFGKVMAAIPDVAPLYMGLILHDIGKGRGSGHVQRGVAVAERVCKRLGFDPEGERDAIFLVRHHLLMSHLSQRRDLTEEKLIEEFVSTVGDMKRLRMLLLLTYGDMSGVGPGVWNDWKGALLWELYDRARSYMTGGRPAGRSRAASLKERVTRELADEFLPSEVERHFALLPERYLRATSAEQIKRHVRLINHKGDDRFAAEWRTEEKMRCTELTICARDSEGLFARLAGTLTASGMNILSADLYTREDGIVIDTFKTSQIGTHLPVREELWPRIEKNLRAAIEGHYDVAAAVASCRAKTVFSTGNRAPHSRARRGAARPVEGIAPSTVRFDAEASATATVIEVRADDEPGLAYRIASAMSSLGLNITFAKIATEKGHALDIFYVTDSTGQKLAAAETIRIERALLEALAGEPGTRGAGDAGTRGLTTDQ